ncbi:GntR family transcriptional regulator [Bacillus aquiflavi]|uniref:GntR family transcriptional regulator n=1 Tax=Bacillus aquiflavi TaxID=2672567 RepID=A0A6B3VZW9_9BACI|nr:GntR family transcriptional regulator [Bacillus aquiflavi]MBA4538434.1 GntR family transcriptional regulator [Bacillus aquiflavi]NEY82798.1 GntR family transcriptional regulator [Bacillus aquiflavi]UAC47366.1 GntR family transcriptional regulator [Bacillus aquiflavi]
MSKQFQASQPIYLQIVDRICRQIVRNELLPSEKLPSVREMALQCGVNPNTIQRTYSELERMGIVETKRGQGTFVCENGNAVQELKLKLQSEIITNFVKDMKEMGLSEAEMLLGVKRHLKKIAEESHD